VCYQKQEKKTMKIENLATIDDDNLEDEEKYEIC
jgi:hypothetical protein